MHRSSRATHLCEVPETLTALLTGKSDDVQVSVKSSLPLHCASGLTSQMGVLCIIWVWWETTLGYFYAVVNRQQNLMRKKGNLMKN